MEVKEKIIDEEIVGKYFKQNCGDTLLVLEKIIEGENKGKYRCQFQKYLCEVIVRKDSLKNGQVLNPQIEVEEFINKIWPQNCGDTLRIIRKTNKQNNNKESLFEAEFQKYPYIIEATKASIKRGKVINPQIEINEFSNKIWPQHCGDSLKIIRKTNERDKRNKDYLWEAEFINYPYKVLVYKDRIQKGTVNNPQLDLGILMSKEWPQKCGDVVKVLGRSKKIGKNVLYEIEFQKVKYRDKKYKYQIINGECFNPLLIQEEEKEFMSKEYPQVGGETLIIIDIIYYKDKKYGWRKKAYLVGYQKYPYIEIRKKGEILSGTCANPNLPWKSKNLLKKYIQEKFQEEKPTLQELAKSLNIMSNTIGQAINKFGLRDLIKYYDTNEQNTLRDYIKEIYTEEIIENFGNTKEYNYYEIDIYLPKLKIGFEYNGSYWHNLREEQEPGYHQKKEELFAEKGIKIYYIWDYEWFKDKSHTIINEECKEKVKNIIFN